MSSSPTSRSKPVIIPSSPARLPWRYSVIALTSSPRAAGKTRRLLAAAEVGKVARAAMARVGDALAAPPLRLVRSWRIDGFRLLHCDEGGELDDVLVRGIGRERHHHVVAALPLAEEDEPKRRVRGGTAGERRDHRDGGIAGLAVTLLVRDPVEGTVPVSETRSALSFTTWTSTGRPRNCSPSRKPSAKASCFAVPSAPTVACETRKPLFFVRLVSPSQGGPRPRQRGTVPFTATPLLQKSGVHPLHRQDRPR
jgi:hypothetical protein